MTQWKKLSGECPEVPYSEGKSAIKVKIKKGDQVIDCIYRDCVQGKYLVPFFYNLESGEIYKDVEEWAYV